MRPKLGGLFPIYTKLGINMCLIITFVCIISPKSAWRWFGSMPFEKWVESILKRPVYTQFWGPKEGYPNIIYYTGFDYPLVYFHFKVDFTLVYWHRVILDFEEHIYLFLNQIWHLKCMQMRSQLGFLFPINAKFV